MAEENCGRCGHANLVGAKYCSRCTALLDVKCPDCSHANAHGSRFCSQCAAPLAGVRYSEPPRGSRRWLIVAVWSVVIVGISAFMLRTVFGTGSVEGEVRSRGKPYGDYVLKAVACFSGDRENFFGAWITPELEDKGDRYGAKGGLKLVKNALGEWEIYVESPIECDGFKCSVRPLDAKRCTVFDVDVRNTNTLVNDVVERRGHAKLDCQFREGGALTANVTFDECH